MKKLTALLLWLLMSAALCAGVSAETVTEVQSMDLNLHMDPLGIYAARAFGAEDYTPRAVDNLSESEKKAYDVLQASLEALVRGDADTSGAILQGGYVMVPILEEELGNNAVYPDSFSQLLDELKFYYFAVGVALYTEHPELCFWSNERVMLSYSSNTEDNRVTGVYIGLSVGNTYQTGEGELDLVSMSTGAREFARVEAAKTRALQIVSNGVGMGTDERLRYYADRICALNTYNDEAAGRKDGKDPSYFEPWKLVYVFDGDPATNAVCEGYSKAFKYLCDLTGFADADVICVTGDLLVPGQNLGGHMWNLVARPDGNYLVDVTNMDSGWGDKLFLVHCEEDPEKDMWVSDGEMGYRYDSNMLAIHTLAELDVREKEAPGPFSGACGRNLVWSLDDGVLTITGSGDMSIWQNAEDVPWAADRGWIRSVILPNGLTTIGTNAFSSCRALQSVTIPDSVEYIYSNAFSGCSTMRSVIFSNAAEYIGAGAFENCVSLMGADIPDSVSGIGRRAFSGCTNLIQATLPAGIDRVEDGLFNGCSSLREITIPAGVASIGMGAFMDCTDLERVTIPDSVTSIDSLAFRGCSSLTGVMLPCGLTSLNTAVFMGCSSMTWAVIPHSVTAIHSSAFSGCSSLRDIYFGGTADSWAGMGISSVIDADKVCCLLSSHTLVLPEDLTFVDTEAMSGTAADAVMIPARVTTLAPGAFSAMGNLRTLIFLGNPAVIADNIVSGSVVVLCPEGSAAAWAESRGFPVLPLEVIE